MAVKTDRCEYCGAHQRQSRLKIATIIFQDSVHIGANHWKKTITRKTSLYCAGKRCAAHDQEAHERTYP